MLNVVSVIDVSNTSNESHWHYGIAGEYRTGCIVWSIGMGIVTFIGMIGNGVILFVHTKRRKEITLFQPMTAMAVLGLFSCVFVHPFSLYIVLNDKPYITGVCKLLGYFIDTRLTVTVLFHFTLVVNRYLDTCCQPQSYNTFRRNTNSIFLANVVFGLFINVFKVEAFSVQTIQVDTYEGTVEHRVCMPSSKGDMRTYHVVQSSAILIVFIIIYSAYGRVYVYVRKKTQTIFSTPMATVTTTDVYSKTMPSTSALPQCSTNSSISKTCESPDLSGEISVTECAVSKKMSNKTQWDVITKCPLPSVETIKMTDSVRKPPRLHGHATSTNRTTKMQNVRMTFLMTVFLCITWAPYCILTGAAYSCPSNILCLMASLCFGFVDNVINTIIYYSFNTQFREECKNTLVRKFL